MAQFDAVTRDHVLAAMEDYDAVGGDALLERMGYGGDGDGGYVRLQGRTYDVRAVMGVAYMRATRQAIAWDALGRTRYAAGQALADLGFDVAMPSRPLEPEPVARPVRTRAASTRTARTATSPAPRRAAAPARTPAPEPRPVAVCPTCFLALPATGVCDDCD